MSQPRPAADAGNPFLGPYPAEITTSLADTTGRQLLMLTIRTGPATVSVLLVKADALNWAQVIRTAAEAMSSSGLIVGSVAPPPSGNGGGHG